MIDSSYHKSLLWDDVNYTTRKKMLNNLQKYIVIPILKESLAK